MATALRVKLRAAEYKQSDLPSRFHASPAPEQRLIAVLVLEAHPDPVYLRWQAEAVASGPPFLGSVAAQSLIGAALRLPPDELPWVDLAVRRSLQLLNALPAGSPAGGARQDVEAAQGLCDMRTGRKVGKMKPDDLELFLTDVTREFDLVGLRELCSKRLESRLERMARPTDPPEYIAVALLNLAREKGWEPLFIEAAHLERPLVPGLALIRQRYTLAA